MSVAISRSIKAKSIATVVALGVLLGSGVAALRATRTSVPARSRAPREAAKARLVQNYGKLPLSFEPNVGQVRSHTTEPVKFVARGRGYTLFLTSSKVALVLRTFEGTRDRYEKLEDAKLYLSKRALQRTPQAPEPESRIPAVLQIEMSGTKGDAKIVGLNQLQGKSNYFLGNDPSKWRTHVPHYGRVRVRDAWPGVDLIYYGNNAQLEYDFVVVPGADPQVIRLKFCGADRLDIDGSGDLVMRVREGQVRLRKPVIYQEIAGRRRPVEGGYLLAGRRQVAFRIGAYNHNQPLVIDPTLVYGTFLGGSSDDFAFGVAVDAAGNAYVGGQTDSTDYLSPNSTLIGSRGLSDIFVTKIDTTKTGAASLVYSTVFGGSADDIFGGIAIDALGNAYVAGGTTSVDFPTANPLSCCGSLQGPVNAFVTKLNPAGNQLLFSTYLGGSRADAVFGGSIAVDASGNIYIASDTRSPDLPVTPGAFQTTLGGVRNAFVAKIGISPSNQGMLMYSSFLGGSGDDRAFGIAIDGSSKVYVCGGTTGNFPGITPAGFQPAFGGGSFDAFVAKMNLGGAGASDLLYGTYLGGSGSEQAFAIAVDPLGNAYVVGNTGSTNFPTKNALQSTFSGNGDAFVTKINPSLSGPNSLVYSTYLGGGANNFGFGIAVTASGQAYVTGSTDSGNFPTRMAIQPNNLSAFDAFVTKLDPALSGDASLLYSTYLGGTDFDEGTAIAVDTATPANVYIAGDTLSDNFSITSAAFQAACKSCDAITPSADAFLLKISDATPAKAANLAPRGLNFGFQDINTTSSPARIVFLTNSGDSSSLNVSNITVTGDFANTGAGTCPATFLLTPGANCNVRLTFTPTVTGMRTGTLTVTDDAADSPQSIMLVGTGTPTGGQAAVRLDTTSLTFGPQLITRSSAQAITVTDIGNGTLTATCQIIGPNSGDFAASCSACASVSPNASCAIAVVFTPSATGARSATLNINDNAAGSPHMVPLNGFGTDFTLGAASGGSTSASVTAGGTATYNLQLTSVSGFLDLVTLTPHCENVPASSCGVSPGQVLVSTSSPGLFTVTVGTTARRAFAPPASGFRRSPLPLMRVTLPLLLLWVTQGLNTLGARWSPRKATGWSVTVSTAALALSLILGACGGGGGGHGGGGGGGQGTPPGTYTITVTAGAQQVAKNLNLTLTVN